MKIIIVGGGVAGLSAAYDLVDAGHQVTIFEAADTPGGLAAGFQDERWEWALEKFYHHWFSNDYAILNLIEEMGHREKLDFRSPTTSYYHPEGTFALDKKVAPIAALSRAINVLSIPYIGLLDKIRLGAVSFVLTKIPDGTFLEKHTADEWSQRWMGQAAHDLIWRPLLISKFGHLYDQVNMAWLWARLYKRTAELGTYSGGFQGFIDDLTAALKKKGVTIHLGTPVEQIEPQGDGYTVIVEGEAVSADRVLSTTSPHLFSRLTPALPDAYHQQLRSLKSIGAMCMVLALDRPLMEDGTYWLNLPAASPEKSENLFPFLALVEHTNYMEREHYGGDHLVYLGDYLPPDHPNFRLSDDELADLYLPSIKRIRPDFSREWIRKRWVFRAPYSQPVPVVDHSQNIPAIRTPLAGLYLACMSQVYPWDRGTNYAVEIGRQAAQLMLDDVGQ